MNSFSHLMKILSEIFNQLHLPSRLCRMMLLSEGGFGVEGEVLRKEWE